MSASVSVVLPALLRRRAEVIGLGAGGLCFPFAFFGNSLGALLPSGPSGIVLPMVLFSGIAGALACFVAHSSPECPIGAAPRLGIRASLFAAIAGGALRGGAKFPFLIANVARIMRAVVFRYLLHPQLSTFLLFFVPVKSALSVRFSIDRIGSS